MTPDPVSGRWLRGIAIATFVVLGVVMCTRDKPAVADARGLAAVGGEAGLLAARRGGHPGGPGEPDRCAR